MNKKEFVYFTKYPEYKEIKIKHKCLLGQLFNCDHKYYWLMKHEKGSLLSLRGENAVKVCINCGKEKEHKFIYE